MSYFERTESNDIAIPRVLVTDPGQCARQQALDILGLWLGEFFLDTSAGFPWQQLLGLKIVSTNQIQKLLEEALLSVTGVTSVTAVVNFDRTTRAFSYSFTATLDTGAVLTGGTNQPFRISTPSSGSA